MILKKKEIRLLVTNDGDKYKTMKTRGVVRSTGDTGENHPLIPQWGITTQCQNVNTHLFEVNHVRHAEIEQKVYITKQNMDLCVMCVFGFICLLVCF